MNFLVQALNELNNTNLVLIYYQMY